MRICAASALERQLAYLSRRFSVVSLETLVERVINGDRPISGELALTFDDGLSCHVRWVYPILRRLGLPATFFVCPGLVESGTWPWTYDVQLRLLTLSEVGRRELWRELGAPAGRCAAALYWMATLPPIRRQAIEEVVRARTRTFRPSDETETLFRPMSWTEMRTLDPRVVSIGSHGMTHAGLPTLDPWALDMEVRGSRALLEQRLDRPVEIFCYPDGQRSGPVVDVVRRSYRAAVTTTVGLVVSGSDPCLLPRFGAGEEALPTLVWRLHQLGA